MSSATLELRGPSALLRTGSVELGPMGRRFLLLIVITLIAYHYTLLSFLDNLRLDTPLAYLAVMPAAAAVMGVTIVRSWRSRANDITDRQIDLILAVPLLLAALALVTVVPTTESTFYWSNRPDVLSFALFVSGAVTALFGVRWLWRLRAALALLFLMWPQIYVQVGAPFLARLTDATDASVTSASRLLPLGVTPTSDPSVLSVATGANDSMQIAIGSACAGGNSLLAFAILSAVSLVGVQGSWVRKLGWLGSGLLLLFVVNVVRLLSILTLVATGHPEFALGGFHAAIGLVLFVAVIGVLFLLRPRFGLRGRESGARHPSQRPAPPALTWSVKGVVGALLLGSSVAVTAIADDDLSQYAIFSDIQGKPAVLPFGTESAAGTGWSIQFLDQYAWAARYFGDGSAFDRYVVSRSGSAPVYADVVRTYDRTSLDTYGLANCYLFHNDDILGSQRVDLGGGVTGLLINYQDQQTGRRWVTVAWAWPINNGDATEYERIALTSNLLDGVSPPRLAIGDSSGGIRGTVVGLLNAIDSQRSNDRTYASTDTSVEVLARTLVSTAVLHAHGEMRGEAADAR